ncbi:DUF2982 domain-containing protein [Algibacillus agarilyticus]|uniref:DUF2982 domain-containing protein n=1 Tax=Algibacillus agarilyticus TaxID=2234133 RepID=UPI000DCFB5A1|nr:DUF2982 domain-containing protein [Algibacillus agarilyticus]
MRLSLLQIKPINRENGFKVCFFSVVFFLLYLLFFHTLTQPYPIIKITYLLTCFIGFLLGLLKIIEPVISCELDDTGLIYYLKKGELKVRWQDIRRMGDVNFESRKLPYIGIKLISLDNVLNDTSLRVMSNLIVQQRALLGQVMSQSCETGTCISEDILNTDPFKTAERTYKGVQAMFAHQLVLLDTHLGYHILLPEGALDRQPDEFIRLMRQYKIENVKYT